MATLRGFAYDPWEHAASLEVSVVELRLREGRWGEYRHRDRLIVLARGLTRIEARSTLAHEVQHAIFGDFASPFGPIWRRQERRADRCAAEWLIDVDEYARAEARHEGHAGAIALELGVIPEVVHSWRAAIMVCDPAFGMSG